MESQEMDGQFKVTVPQNGLNVMVDGFRIIPPMGLGSWVGFGPTLGEPMIMGDIVVIEKDQKPVQQEVIKQGLTVALVKTVFIVRLTFIQLSKIIGESHQLTQDLTLFGVLIVLIVLSFSADYQALHILDSENFKTATLISGSVLLQAFDFVYFNLINFSSVGYGNMVPVSIAGKLLVMMEIFLSFLVLIFGIANINRIHVDNK